ncbi:DUF503 domain-containing protein [Fuchsiella alkaliacetigena]|uniref:DUF503 domain-containing protein n=1 Tax=Fuchsiella alkaliacetigena TaxID=957042 RepID=UPI00200BA042|nr:DUF503 domain-containing protein [Fuchsiella alkaliacetigena]MCK8825677.1 DUF503 domain-containing protein [Fuchsiella alkaliacetigena]
MVIGLCTVELRVPMSNSLKHKRGVIKSLIAKLKNRFNISVAEIEQNDNLKLATIGIVTISNQRQQVERSLEKVVRFIEDFNDIYLLKDTMELI